MAAKISNFSEQMAVGRIHARSRAFARSLDFAREGTAALISASPRCYVSLSFGKQSLCVAHMAMEIKPDIPMFFLASTETWLMYDYRKVVDSFVERFVPNLTIVQTDRLAEADDWKGARDLGDHDLQRMCPREDWDGWLWGLAEDESRARRITIRQGIKQGNAHPSIFRYADGKLRGCPIMRWGIDDLAAYIQAHDLPMLNIYRLYGLTQRTTARITKKMVNYDGLALLKATSGGDASRLLMDHEEIH